MLGARKSPHAVAVRKTKAIRPRAWAQLCDAARRPIAVVVAPAGFGKSALLRAFAARRESALLVDVGRDTATFRGAVRALCEALRAVVPGPRLTFAGAYARATEGGDRAKSMAHWLGRHLDRSGITLVVDSIDRLGDETRVFAEFAEVLATSGPAAPHLVLGTRDDADLPIPRWLADDLIALPIDANALRWTPEEAQAAARRIGFDGDESAVARIVEASHGRAFDVLYALRTGATPSDGDPGEMLFRGLTPEERAYVLETCLLPSFDDRVLAAIGLPIHPLLGASSRLGGLAIRPQAEGHRYEDGLRVRAQAALRANPAAHQCTAERTVAALELTGRVREALELAGAANLRARVHQLLRLHGLDLEDRGDADAVEAALELLPEEVDDAVVVLLRATRESRLGRTDTSEAWFTHAIARAESRAVSAEAAYRLARELVRRGRADAVELLEPYANDETLAEAQRSAILAVLAEAYLIADRPADAHAAIRRALLRSGVLDEAARASLLTRASYVELYAGDRERAREYATHGGALAEQTNLYTVAFGAYSVLYNIAYEDSGPTESLACLARLGECAVRSGNVDFQLYALAAAYELQVERGDLVAIERLERDLREFDVHYAASAALEGLIPSRALVEAWSGAFDSAYEILAPSGPHQTAAGREALRWAEIALYASAAGQRDAAADALHRFDDAFGRDAEPTDQAVRGAILARLAAELSGSASPRAAVTPAGRLGALARAVDAFVAHRRGDAGATTLLGALDDLVRHELAGMAKLFAALPGPRA
jgi:hypothetical protein